MPSYAQTLKNRAEAALDDPRFDFIAKYHAVADLRRLARQHPSVLDEQTIGALKRLLQTNAFRRIRQAYFLFREAASVMTDMAGGQGSDGVGPMALAALEDLLLQTTDSAHRGVAEALGSLPVAIRGPRLGNGDELAPPIISWAQLLDENHLGMTGLPRYIGRSLVVETSAGNRLLVVKLSQRGDTPAGLAREIRWMELLKTPDYAVSRRFNVPVPLYVGNQPVFRINSLPLPPPGTVDSHPDGWAIAFLAHGDYFVYPNHNEVDGQTALEILERNAHLMGWLAARGVIHDAPIPLFHNRTQRLRRDDRGRYQWFRSGRLDQWLDSCAFPNFGMSGLRDFEHLQSFNGESRLLYRHLGSHFLSLILVAASHFRCRDKTRVGLDENRQPVDARDLFDQPLLKAMIRKIYTGYFAGFTGRSASPPPPLDLDRLTRRIIGEMGVDRHMTELLRRTDQEALTDGEFSAFLQSRGFGPQQLNNTVRGKKDILITSGPHLGDFNRQISLPELIEGVAAMSAVCIAGRFAIKALPGRG
jgi:hypothetical protein